jgi:plastocyanin
MIWLWLICSSAVIGPLFGSSVSGRVELRDSQDSAVSKKKDFGGVVISLSPAGVEAVKLEPGRARMIQKNKTFTPHVLAVTTGTLVEFPNLDPIFHSAFSNYNGQVFDLGLYAPGSTRSVRFSRPGVVRIFCNIHDQMSAIIVVLSSPWFDVTNHDGTFRIPDVPPGEYRVNVFHERAISATLDAATKVISIGGDPVTLPVIAISESGYLAIPHKNKYGRDYTPPPSDRGLYPTVRK